jgi:hypothetical protein
MGPLGHDSAFARRLLTQSDQLFTHRLIQTNSSFGRRHFVPANRNLTGNIMQTNDTHSSVRFKTGRPTVTPAATAALELAKVPDILVLARHIHGDWGDLGERDCLQNELAVLLELRIVSRYVLLTGSVIQVVTEADRSATTILVCDDY